MLGENIARLCRGLLSQECLLCAGASAEHPLCTHCIRTLPPLARGCPVCALPGPPGQTCGRCLAHPPHFDRTAAAWTYAFPVDRLVQAFKFHQHLELAPWFAQLLAPLCDFPGGLVLAMPLHRARLAERGFNQALEISRHVAALTGKTLLHSDVHKRLDTRPQSALPLDLRAKNVRNAFQCDVKFKSSPMVIVVDDVMTTGATLNELAQTLKIAGAGTVVNLVVARTLPPHEYQAPITTP